MNNATPQLLTVDKVKIERRKKRTSITCPACNNPAITYTSTRLSAQVTNKYCACTNNACAATFIMTLSFTSYITEPLSSPMLKISALLKSLSQADIAEIRSQLLD